MEDNVKEKQQHTQNENADTHQSNKSEVPASQIYQTDIKNKAMQPQKQKFDEASNYSEHANGANSGNRPPMQPNALDTRALRSAQSKITFAYIAGPLSLLVGGMLLGTIGFVCSALALKQLSQLQHKEPSIAHEAKKLLKSARTALIICAVAFVLNAISMYFMYPILLDMLQSGQYGEVASNLGAGTSPSTSAWG